MFQCTFCGHTTTTRQNFRRHLTLKHDADCRFEKGESGKFADVIVALSAAELASRVAVLRKGQRHVRRRGHERRAVEPVEIPLATVLPTSFVSSISANYSTPTAEATETHHVPADEACSSVASEFNFGHANNVSIDWEREELLFMDMTSEIPPPDLSWWGEPYRADTPTECSEEGWSRGAVKRADSPRVSSDPLPPAPVEAPPSVMSPLVDSHPRATTPPVASSVSATLSRPCYEPWRSAEALASILAVEPAMDLTTATDRAAALLGIERSDVISWRALYAQALAAGAMERRLVRLVLGTTLQHVFTPDMVCRLNRPTDGPSPPASPVPHKDLLALDYPITLGSDSE